MPLSTKSPLVMLRELRDAIMNTGPAGDRERLRAALNGAGAALNGRGDPVQALMALHDAASTGLDAEYLDGAPLGLAMGEGAEVLVANGSGYPEWRRLFAERGDRPGS